MQSRRKQPEHRTRDRRGDSIRSQAAEQTRPQAIIICYSCTVSYTHLDVYKRQRTSTCGRVTAETIALRPTVARSTSHLWPTTEKKGLSGGFNRHNTKEPWMGALIRSSLMSWSEADRAGTFASLGAIRKQLGVRPDRCWEPQAVPAPVTATFSVFLMVPGAPAAKGLLRSVEQIL